MDCGERYQDMSAHCNYAHNLTSYEIKAFHLHVFTRILHHVWVYYELSQFISYSKISLSAGKKALTT